MLSEPPRVLLGVCGSIAAYKAVEVARRLGDAGIEVQAALTNGAAQFVTSLTFEAVTGRPVLDDPWARRQEGITHVEQAHRIQLMVVAPATAHTLARLAHGFADDPLTAIALSTQAPIVVAPAMEHGMWHHPATQANLQTLRERGVEVVGPARGSLASGRTGDGRMAEPMEVVHAVLARLRPRGDLRDERAVITAGPTWEPLDPVRFLGNRSTGAMGLALAEIALSRGASVRLVLGPTPLSPPHHPNLEVVRVETAEEMLEAAGVALDTRTVVVGAAAVGDFRPARRAEHKLKRSHSEARHLELSENPDILSTLSSRIGGLHKHGIVVGFAAETEDVVKHARAKLSRKGCDLVIGNLVGPGRGFGPGATEVVAVRDVGEPVAFGPAQKYEVAGFVWDQVRRIRSGMS